MRRPREAWPSNRGSGLYSRAPSSRRVTATDSRSKRRGLSPVRCDDQSSRGGWQRPGLRRDSKAVARVRSALGDEASESSQMFAMASLSATSLDVVRYWVAGERPHQGRLQRGKAKLLQSGRAGSEVRARLPGPGQCGDKPDEPRGRKKYVAEALRQVGSMTERERYTIRGGSYRISGDYRQCVKEYSELLASYPADVAAHNNLRSAWQI